MCGSIIKKDISSNSKINFNNVNERMITGVEHIIKKYFDIVFGKEKDGILIFILYKYKYYIKFMYSKMLSHSNIYSRRLKPAFGTINDRFNKFKNNFG